MSFWAAFLTTRWFYVKLFLETIIKIILCAKKKNVQLCTKCAVCLESWMFTILIRICLSCRNAKLKLIKWFTICISKSLFVLPLCKISWLWNQEDIRFLCGWVSVGGCLWMYVLRSTITVSLSCKYTGSWKKRNYF